MTRSDNDAPGLPRPRHRPPRFDRLHAGVRAFYFITFNTHRRIPLLANDEVHAAFRSFCIRGRDRGALVGRYVLLPDHVHLFVALSDDGPRPERWVQSMKSVMGKTLLRMGHAKPHWQEGFFDHVLRSDESYAEKWEYVRENPVRAELVSKWEDWPYQGEVNVLRW